MNRQYSQVGKPGRKALTQFLSNKFINVSGIHPPEKPVMFLSLLINIGAAVQRVRHFRE